MIYLKPNGINAIKLRCVALFKVRISFQMRVRLIEKCSSVRRNDDAMIGYANTNTKNK